MSSLRKYDHILAAIYIHTYTVVAIHHCCPQSNLCHRSLSSTSSTTHYCYRYCHPRPHHLSRQHRLRPPRLISSTKYNKYKYNKYKYKYAKCIRVGCASIVAGPSRARMQGAYASAVRYVCTVGVVHYLQYICIPLDLWTIYNIDIYYWTCGLFTIHRHLFTIWPLNYLQYICTTELVDYLQYICILLDLWTIFQYIYIYYSTCGLFTIYRPLCSIGPCRELFTL